MRGTRDRLRVLIADDHPVFRHGVRAMLEPGRTRRSWARPTTGAEAVALADRLQPDVVLMDLRMPGMNGIEATRRIVAASPSVRVLVVTMFEDDASVFSSIRAGYAKACAVRPPPFLAYLRPAGRSGSRALIAGCGPRLGPVSRR